MFLAGIVIFTLASLAGGLATSAGMLLAARAVQGVGGALASPAVLALVIGGFAEGSERLRALSVYSAVVTAGGSLGLVLGGLIIQWTSWRWVLFINVPIGIAVIAATPRYVTETPRQSGRFDLPGAVTSTSKRIRPPFRVHPRRVQRLRATRSPPGAFLLAAVLLTAFVANEARAEQPITPLRLFASVGRSSSFFARVLLVGGMSGMFFFLTQYLQEVLGLDPLVAGLAFLPMTLLLFGVSRLAPWLMARIGGWRLMVSGMLPLVAGMAYAAPGCRRRHHLLVRVLCPLILLGTGMGVVFVPLTTVSLAGVAPEDSGAVSSMVNVTQQLGGSVGLAALVAVFGSAQRHALAQTASLSAVARHVQALTHGVSAALTLAAVLDLAALVVIGVLLRPRRPAAPDSPVAVGDRSKPPAPPPPSSAPARSTSASPAARTASRVGSSPEG